METLTIHAASRESARGMLLALASFRAEMLETDRGWDVVVGLGRGDSEIVAVLNALEDHVTERANGPARVEIDGHSYVMHPQPADEPAR